jgi:hypothetical protein
MNTGIKTFNICSGVETGFAFVTKDHTPK